MTMSPTLISKVLPPSALNQSRSDFTIARRGGRRTDGEPWWPMPGKVTVGETTYQARSLGLRPDTADHFDTYQTTIDRS
jgi:hypothetical protein